ncbi:MAG: Ig-like domain-containing protein, partial [Rudaea sp.]
MHRRLVLALATLLLLAACVPSPTATPPRATPFPTLPPQPTDAPLPTMTLTRRPPAAATPALAQTSTPALSPRPTASPTPTFPAAALAVTPVSHPGMLSPVLQVFPSELGELVSIGQRVQLGIIASDDLGLVRVDLYDEGKQVDRVAAPKPAPRLFTVVLDWKSDRVGPHHLSLVAVDTDGNSSAPVAITFDVVTDNKRPGAQFTNVVGVTDVPVGGPILLQGVASDDVAIKRVDLYVDDLLYTYVAPDNSNGESPFAFNLAWVPVAAGAHKLYLRAHDNQDQTGDSPVLIVNALASQPPAVAVRFERDEVVANRTLVVYVLALSPNGITRVELWADEQLVGTVNTTLPEGQTALDAAIVWQPTGSVGDHLLLVRAFDRTGASTSTDPHLIHVRRAGTPLATDTPRSATATPASVLSSETTTPAVIVPAPPSIALATPQNLTAVGVPGSLHVTMTAHGSAELDHVELWAYYTGETTPSLLFSDTIKGTTDHVLSYDWLPPRVGTALVYARVVDRLGQLGQSPLLTVYLGPPPAPTPVPANAALSPVWSATIPTARFAVSFVQIGRALRGRFTATTLNGSPLAGQIVAGSITG